MHKEWKKNDFLYNLEFIKLILIINFIIIRSEYNLYKLLGSKQYKYFINWMYITIILWLVAYKSIF